MSGRLDARDLASRGARGVTTVHAGVRTLTPLGPDTVPPPTCRGARPGKTQDVTRNPRHRRKTCERNFIRRAVLPGVAALALVLSACGGDARRRRGHGGGGASGSVAVDGSSTVFPMSDAAAELLSEENPDIEVSVSESGTAEASRSSAPARPTSPTRRGRSMTTRPPPARRRASSTPSSRSRPTRSRWSCTPTSPSTASPSTS